MEKQGIGPLPLLDRGFQVADFAEIAEQPYHARNVVRMIAALQKPPARHFKIRHAFLHGDARELISERYRERSPVLIEIGRLSRIQIQVQGIYRVFLRPRPDGFAGNIGSDGREYLKTDNGNA